MVPLIPEKNVIIPNPDERKKNSHKTHLHLQNKKFTISHQNEAHPANGKKTSFFTI
jgi:hypothetical protein